MPATWPNKVEYSDAIQAPAHCFQDPDLRAGNTVVDALGLPAPCSGGFAVVYQVRSADRQKSWAVKCFTKSVPGLKERYREISRHLAQAQLPLAVEFKYLEEGILIRGAWYPVLKMDWVAGLTLRQFVQDNLHKPKLLESLYRVWLKVDPLLVRAGVAHGDLQHGNVLLVPGKREGAVSLRLIDYDGMWVPALAGQPPPEAGHPAYQHPQRAKRNIYTADVDRFPQLAIACALKCLARAGGPDLWRQYDDGDNLLFKKTDFETPGESALLRELWTTGDRELRAWVGQLVLASQSPLEETPPVSRLLVSGRMPPQSREDELRTSSLLGLQRIEDWRGRELAAVPGSEELVASAGVPSSSVGEGNRAGHWILDGMRGTAARFIPRHTYQRLTVALVAGAMLVALAAAVWRVNPISGSGDSYAGRHPGQERDDNDLKMKFCWCSPGTFTMGSPENESGRRPSEDPVEVTITQGFWMGKYEVTQGEWQTLMGTDPSHFSPTGKGRNLVVGQNTDRYPVENVSWHEATEFCEKLTDRERRAGRLPSAWAYRLPTEAQWERACRAGTTTKTAFGDALSRTQANFGNPYGVPSPIAVNGMALGRPTVVGSYPPNDWGLFDMHGNVGEYCRGSCPDKLPGGIDPDVESGGVFRVNRGGSWFDDVSCCRSAFRFRFEPGIRMPALGFRVAAAPTTAGSSESGPAGAAAREPALAADSGSNPVATNADSVNAEAEIMPGHERNDNELLMKFCLCPPGKFMMGSPKSEPQRSMDEEQVQVTLTEGFWMGKYEVTQWEWKKLMETNPSQYSQNGTSRDQVRGQDTDRFPVESVLWVDAALFCEKLTADERRAGRLSYGWEYRLPTEAQWEYACRAGTATATAYGETLSTAQSNISGRFDSHWGDHERSLSRTTAVGSYAPNAWGLFDMHGNVGEWCFDSYTDKLPGGNDPRVDPTGSQWVYRGGSYASNAVNGRSARRMHDVISGRSRSSDRGFRIARVPIDFGPSNPNSKMQGDPYAGKVSGQEREDNELKMKFCWCPPGGFTMGSPRTEFRRGANEDRDRVMRTEGFWLGKYEVTQGEWQSLLGTNPSRFSSDGSNKRRVTGHATDRFPVENVSWEDVTLFCEKLTEQEHNAMRLPSAWAYRLPTEAQWEYACRAGTSTATAFGDKLSSTQANFNGKNPYSDAAPGPSLERTTTVGSYSPNAWGFFDMHGNIAEWCHDLVKSAGTASLRGVRGGSWFSVGADCRSAFRTSASAAQQRGHLGFRVAIVPAE